jgi:DNA topoisomerase-1
MLLPLTTPRRYRYSSEHCRRIEAIFEDMAKKKTSGRSRVQQKVPSLKGKELVIVESPSKARTINKYLGSNFVVLASVGHVRDLPSRNPKGQKSPVPGVDLEKKFAPTYEVLSGKGKTLTDLKRAGKQASAVWFATDLDREGEAIAWHLADEIGIDPSKARRVVFSAITKAEIERAFQNPHPIDMDRVNAQQARRILDRIVGYQVSPLLWKKVARGLSAGRVQSVASRLVVEREREIRAFMPDEYWQIFANFSSQLAKAESLAKEWLAKRAERDAKGKAPTLKALNAWLAKHGSFRAELVEVAGKKFEMKVEAPANGDRPIDLSQRVIDVARLAGLSHIQSEEKQDERGKGPASTLRSVSGTIDPAAKYAVRSVETKRTRSRPSGPFITSTLQQTASSRLGFAARRTMRTAQSLYEGVDIPGEGPVGLITYMRTDSTHIAGEALSAVRTYIQREFGAQYLPEKPNFFGSTNKQAQEAHEAIRPTSLNYPPERVKPHLKPDQFKLYNIIWQRFVSCQMTPAEWDSTTLLIEGGIDAAQPVVFRATGRALAFDGFCRVSGVPTATDEQTLPTLGERQALAAFALEPRQRFTSPPARYSEASLIRTLESEGIGRPSTYASIIQVIQDRKYAELIDRRFYATDLGEVVTDKLIEAFPRIMDVGYTRYMESELDKIEEEHLDWIQMLEEFYGPFKDALEHAHKNLNHAKAETQPAPDEYRCATCESPTVYRFGRSGRFLSCSRYPDCTWASPVDRDGKPRPIEETNVACPRCSGPMIKRSGRFGSFLGCARYGDEENPCDGILNLDKKTGQVTAPSRPPLRVEELQCGKCGEPMNLRTGLRGPWLGCSAFPKCRGRMAWTKLEGSLGKRLTKELAAHEKALPIAIIRTLDGTPLTDVTGKPLPDAPRPGNDVPEPEPADAFAD